MINTIVKPPNTSYNILTLFNLVAKGLYMLIIGVTKDGMFSGIKIRSDFQVCHLQSIDDTLIFIHNETKSLLNVIKTIRWFSNYSKLIINYHKSSLI
jgi:hypothetical protein